MFARDEMDEICTRISTNYEKTISKTTTEQMKIYMIIFLTRVKQNLTCCSYVFHQLVKNFVNEVYY